jgi:uncharacterized protein (DUF4415 family)
VRPSPTVPSFRTPFEICARGLVNSGGRPKSANPKRAVSLRLDADVIEWFKRSGDGWQTRINRELRKAAGL